MQKPYLFIIFCLALACSSLKTSNQPSYQGLGRQSVPPELIKQYEAPSLPDADARFIQSMLDVRSPDAGITSPTGDKLFFNWNVTGTMQVWRVDGPNTFPTQLTGGSDTTRLSGITPDGKWLVVSRDYNGEENPGLYLLSTAGGELKKVFHQPRVQSSLQYFSPDSQSFLYAANDERPDSYAIYRYNISSNTREKVFGDSGIWSVKDVRDDGLILLCKDVGSLWMEYYLYDEKTKKLLPLLGQDEHQEYRIRFAKNHDEYFVLTNKFGEFRRLYHLKAQKYTPVTPEKNMDISNFRIDYPRRHLYLDWNDKGYSIPQVLNASTFAPIAFPPLPKAELIRWGTPSRNGRFVTLQTESANDPGRNFSFDWQTGKLTKWVHSSFPEISEANFPFAKLESYPARDGTQIPMFVHRPAKCAQSPCPVIIQFHGGPEVQTLAGFKPLVQIFLANGFVVVEPNVRGSDGYGKTWIGADDGPKRLNIITDIEDAALYVKKNWGDNGKVPKVGILGGSYGGYSSLMGMTRFAGAFDAGVAIVGMSNLISFLNNTAPYRRQLRISEYGDPEKDKVALEKLSPITYVDQVKDPLLIIQGVSDPRVPAGEAIQIQKALNEKKIQSELILIADEGHGSAKRENKVIQYGHTLLFFKKHLLGKEKL